MEFAFKKPDSALPKTIETYRAIVAKAVKLRHVFIDYAGYPIIRAELRARGWIEKLPPASLRYHDGMRDETLMQFANEQNNYEIVLMARLLEHQPAFYVLHGRFCLQNLFRQSYPLRNRIDIARRLDYSCKYGLIACKEQQERLAKLIPFRMNVPRAYRLGDKEQERQAFIEDFRQTLCRNLLQFLLDKQGSYSEIADDKNGQVYQYYIEMAFLSVRIQVENLYPNEMLKKPAKHVVIENEWISLEEHFDAVMNGKQKFRTSPQALGYYVKEAESLLDKVYAKRPELRWDGCQNVWILKPAGEYCGKGIVVERSLKNIINFSNFYRDRNYLVQKYLERPLLIYGAKFDIRMYAMVKMSQNFISVWLYKDCYFKVSSRKLNLQDTSTNIHLTNFAVQRYCNNFEDPRLPTNHMWDLKRFKRYLYDKQIPTAWSDIYTQIGQNISATILSAFQTMSCRANNYELYGIDFMLDEDCKAILIEYNHTPDLNHSTAVTAKVCPALERDVVKLLVDYADDPRKENLSAFEKILDINYHNGKFFDGKDNRLLGQVPVVLKDWQRLEN